MRRHKYGAKVTWVDGIRFDSMAEAEFYRRVKTDIEELQPKVYLTRAKLLYKPDFLMKDGTYIDIKGMETPVFKLKKRLWKHYGPGRLEIWVKKGSNFIVTETVDGKV